MYIHIIGIGGVSTSAIAKYLIGKGFTVSGSEQKASIFTKELEQLGVKITYFHDYKNCIGKDLIIYNSAISNDNPEFRYAVENKIPLLKRSEVLKLISKGFGKTVGVAGSHGKTTVTSLLCHVFDRANLSFMSHIGGLDHTYGNYYSSGNEVFLSEVCEFEKNVNNFDADYAVLLNVDDDHLDCYESFDDLKQTFYAYLERAKYRIVNRDDENLKHYYSSSITFGLNQGDYHLKNLCKDGYCTRFTVVSDGKSLFDLRTSLVGNYNLSNVLSAVALSKTIGIDDKYIIGAVSAFNGVKRRNEMIGEINGAIVVADYAHHPKEIKCFLSSLSAKKNDVHLVFQPHTYSRTKLLFDDFLAVLSDYDNLYLYKTFPARESYDYLGDAKRLHGAIKNSKYYDNFVVLYDDLKRKVNSSNIVIILGAGDLYDYFSATLKKDRN